MSYSKDLRKKVVEFIEQGKTITEASNVFGVSRPAIYKWLKMNKFNKDLSDKPPKRGWKKIDPHFLIDLVNRCPDLTLSEYAKHFGASPVAICLALKNLKITRKKRPLFTANGIKTNALYFWSK